MFRLTIFSSIVAAVRGDDEQASLLQKASRDSAALMADRASKAQTIAYLERELDESLSLKGGCQKVLAAEVKVNHFAEELVKEWKDKFNFKRKVKNDVKISTWCAAKLTANDWKDDDFKDNACKTVEKAKKECSKSLKASCNFVRSVTRKLYKKSLKGSRKVRKESAFTSKRDPLKVKVNAFKCKKYKGVKTDDLNAGRFEELKTHFADIYKEIKELKEVVDKQVAAKDAKKTDRKAALKLADDDHEKCEDAAESKEEDAKLKAAKKRDDEIKKVTESTDSETDKKTKKDAAEDLYKTEKKDAEKQKDIDDDKCDADRKAAKALAEKKFKE